ncbi:2Fe-2S iron-sulfur cluster binding domain-containing protein [Aestuariibacter halophilus]|uniref:2Fe-2S iron-sulfur cluster binding domain-containing protein n=1 Tax=Fluctibacter halophilus TaxID=226011 RepID=A0ABS8GCA8_9ALTE|nr:2Fe-2S iron-sulfur cluster binding domain-containing protein [Aestuariibacter halophilus]MCC2618197.1 2Fe-2S iron-sulfur cluster binding domain-containing protein [Aestuariibacter halophilus]
MFSLFTRKAKPPLTATINGAEVILSNKETLLDAALRAHIDVPFSCRVGGCGTCKCKLLRGSVKALTEFGYILSEAELDQGYILACQSVPRTNIDVEVGTNTYPVKRVTGTIIDQQRLTPAITAIRVQLDDALVFKPGQYADLSLPEQGYMQRSYSFASAPNPDATLDFFVRKVPGGKFSSFVGDNTVLGMTVTVDGPKGDFWLRDADAPLVMIAAGSGLAPILAMLEDAIGCKRPARLLFGARTEQDLYALERIHRIAREWNAPFDFLPTLSNEAPDSGWKGLRGRVTALIDGLPLIGAHAYVCGPPAMVDATQAQLIQSGVEKASVFSDRFLTAADVAGQSVSSGE